MNKALQLFLALIIFTFNPLKSQDCATIYVESTEQLPNSSICMDFVMQSDELLGGFQWTIQWDTTSLTYTALTNQSPLLSNGGFDYNDTGFIEQGKIPVSFFADPFIPLDLIAPEILFTACFTTRDTFGLTSALEISNEPTPIAISDANFGKIDHCVESGEFTLTNNLSNSADILLIGVAQDLDCAAGLSGGIDSYAFFGASPYTYNWVGPNNFVSNTQNITSLTQGNYGLTVTDAEGNTAKETFEISGSATPDIAAPALTNPQCANDASGAIDITVDFGQAPYYYVWSNNTFDEDLTNVAAGTYSVTVVDNIGCAATGEWTLVNPTMGIPSFTQPECYNDSTGGIDITVDFGQQPYTYEWSNNTFIEDLSGVPPGSYSVTVTDANGCQLSGSWNLGYSNYHILFLEVGAPSCYFSNDGFIDLTPNDYAATPLIYEWSNGESTEDLLNIGPEFYTVLVTDANGCENFFDFDLRLDPLPVISEKNAICTTEGLNNGSVSIEISPSFSNYEFGWADSPTELTGNRQNLADGTYSFTVTDTNSGCVVIMDSVTIAPTMLEYVDAYFSCELDSIQFSFEVANGIQSVSWSPAQDFSDPASIDAIYFPPPFDFTEPIQDTIVSSLTLVSNAGCSSETYFELRPREFCVWPGDSNDDRAVNATDILNIGLVNGSSGSARWPLSTEWFAQAQQIFGNTIPGTNLDASFADCDGNGIVEAADTAVVLQNYGLSHFSFKSELAENRSMDIPLWVELPTTFLPNEQNTFDIVLGSATQSIDKAYGIAFQLVYNPDIVNIDLNKVTADGWLSESGEVWTIDVERGTSGTMDVVLTRTDGIGIDGFGKIAELSMQFEEFFDDKDVEFTIRNASLVDQSGTYLAVEGMMTNSILLGTSNSTKNSAFNNEYIFPNPVKNYISIESERNLTAISIFNTTGRLVKQFESSENKINIVDFPTGVYYIHLLSDEGRGVYKFVKL